MSDERTGNLEHLVTHSILLAAQARIAELENRNNRALEIEDNLKDQLAQLQVERDSWLRAKNLLEAEWTNEKKHDSGLDEVINLQKQLAEAQKEIRAQRVLIALGESAEREVDELRIKIAELGHRLYEVPTEGQILELKARIAELEKQQVHTDGHHQPCCFCREECNNLRGNPMKWSTVLAAGNGEIKYAHIGCVANLEVQLKATKEELAYTKSLIQRAAEGELEAREHCDRLKAELAEAHQERDTLVAERDALQSRLDEANAWIGELSNTPSGAIIARLEKQLVELVAERDELASDVRLFVPGNWECGKCKFVLSATTLNVANGTFGTTRHDREEPRYCPNDRTEMSKVSWQKHCEGLYDNLKDRIEVSAKQAEQIAQLQAERDALKAELINQHNPMCDSLEVSLDFGKSTKPCNCLRAEIDRLKAELAATRDELDEANVWIGEHD